MCTKHQSAGSHGNFFRYALLIISILFFSVATSAQQGNKKRTDGCGAGYWKNNILLWDETQDALPFCMKIAVASFGTGYGGNATASDMYSSTFGLSSTEMSDAGLDPALTLGAAINLQAGQLSALARQSVAALLNACAVNFIYSSNDVIQQTHEAMVSHDYSQLLTAFEKANDGDCIKFPLTPIICTISGQSQACTESEGLQYYAFFNGVNGPVSYEWTLINNTAGARLSGAGSGLSDGTAVNIDVVPASVAFTPGTFTLQLTISRGTNISTCTKVVTIIFIPPLSVSLSYDPVTGEQGFPASIQLHALAGGGLPPYNYLWSDLTEVPSGEIFSSLNTANTTVTVFNPGTYRFAVRVLQSTGCLAIAEVSITLDANGNSLSRMAPPPLLRFVCCGLINPDFTSQQPVAIKETPPEPGNAGIRIFPNPNHGVFTVILPVEFRNSEIIITDILGNNIQKWKGLPSRQLKIDQPGVYLIRILDPETQREVVKKVVVLQ